MNIKLLDCTIRDGGLGLEDMSNYNSLYRFSEQQRMSIVQSLHSSGIDIIEVGSMEPSSKDKTGFAIYQNIEYSSHCVPELSEHYAALYRGPDTPLDAIPEWDDRLIKKVRVIIRYSELEKSVCFCAALAEKGYEVFIQPMVTLRYTPEQLSYIICAANKMNAYALYFVDSYGCMDYEDIERLFTMYHGKLADNIYIGFHAHNNMNMAFANVRCFMELAQKVCRNIIIDSTCLGMGQGAGNLQTEIIVPYLNERFAKDYDFDAVLKVCDIINEFGSDTLWGYTAYRFLPALYKTAYKYAVGMRLKYNMSLSEINHVLKSMPNELRYRYTSHNLDSLIKNRNL